MVERRLGEEKPIFHDAGRQDKGYHHAGCMEDHQVGLYETVARIVALAGAPERAAEVAVMRSRFEELTGAFSPDDGWSEERSRAFWCDAVTRARAGRDVEAALSPAERGWLDPLERAHRGLFRAEGSLLRDVWSGAAIELTEVDDSSRAELDASTGQLVDGRVVGAFSLRIVAFLPGAVFHPREASEAIESVLAAARAAALATYDALDALLRMERTAIRWLKA